MRVLCLSNGHGEDAIALRILRELQQQPNPPELAALPIVGEGHAYIDNGISLIGSVKTMPSGGFIYQDGRQLARDIRGGLLQLTLAQLRAIKAWAKETAAPHSPFPTPHSLILAVGDIVPLLFARLSGLPYAFVGTAKSEYYLRDEGGWLPRDSWWDDRLERWTGCIYLPWERWLMSHLHCKAVFPRDTITATSLRRRNIPAFDLGNPMMDGLEWEEKDKGLGIKDKSQDLAFSLQPLALTIALIPGSRPPEAYANWETILQAVNGMIAQMSRPLTLLAAIAPGLDVDLLHKALMAYRWQQLTEDSYTVGLGDRKSTLVLAQRRFAECLHRADVAIAMAGTATEQFVGLGKPAIILPGKGPQFTPRFAEAQTRLLGASVLLVKEPDRVAAVIQSLLQNPDALQTIAENGHRRMGTPGAAKRIADCLMEIMHS
ncbi:MAG: lipid-A-disaccharide synthase-related protein [Leptolyngbya sp. BL-A-14]